MTQAIRSTRAGGHAALLDDVGGAEATGQGLAVGVP
jgi:hypothetical protein